MEVDVVFLKWRLALFPGKDSGKPGNAPTAAERRFSIGLLRGSKSRKDFGKLLIKSGVDARFRRSRSELFR